MSFLLFKKIRKTDTWEYQNLHSSYKLAGFQLIYKLWLKKGQPKNRGWSLTADEILKEHSPEMSSQDYALVIDFHPDSDYRVALIEIENIHLYTYGNSEAAFWTPMMLELSHVFYNEDYKDLTGVEKIEILRNVEVSFKRKRIIEFLYINGDENNWGWGRNGSTNAAFIEEDSREYFKKFF